MPFDVKLPSKNNASRVKHKETLNFLVFIAIMKARRLSQFPIFLLKILLPDIIGEISTEGGLSVQSFDEEFD